MNDVLGQVLFAARAENLLAGDFKGTVALLLGLGAEQAQIRTGRSLCQRHGAEPLSRHEVGEIGVFLLGRPDGHDRGNSTMRQAGKHVEGVTGGVEILLHHCRERMWHALPAMFFGQGKCAPARLDIGGIGCGKAGGRGHRAIRMACTTFVIGDRIQRCDDLGTELSGLADDRIDQVFVNHLENGSFFAVFDVQQVFEDKGGFPLRRIVDRHLEISSRESVEAA